ncbi:PREDICTED: methionine aminopeptidase 2-like [Lupinus angustifolius]|uniref:methionine aminopeptidase 2-like n=1 Tax=Lupinus angustifolius TaxID=3871 RepID=UPI00092F5043|nr:PREDICTED: methionine aminopeptidase 2-like [Lupinus angustifolius]
MENQLSSTNTTTPSSSPYTQFLLLEQVQFLMANDNSLLQWELVNVVDAEDNDSIESELGSLNPPISSPKVPLNEKVCHIHVHHTDDDGDDVDDDDDDDDQHDNDDLDDELVPWDVSNKIGRNRMRKLGKREFPKMINSKRSPHLFVSPGCVHGKHGLGLKHK